MKIFLSTVVLLSLGCTHWAAKNAPQREIASEQPVEVRDNYYMIANLSKIKDIRVGLSSANENSITFKSTEAFMNGPNQSAYGFNGPITLVDVPNRCLELITAATVSSGSFSLGTIEILRNFEDKPGHVKNYCKVSY